MCRGKMCRGKMCRGKMCRGKICTGKMCRGKMCWGKMCRGKMCRVKMCRGKMCRGKMCRVKMCRGKMCRGKMCWGKMCRGKMCRVKMCRGKMCRGKMCWGKMCRGKRCRGTMCRTEYPLLILGLMCLHTLRQALAQEKKPGGGLSSAFGAIFRLFVGPALAGIARVPSALSVPAYSCKVDLERTEWALFTDILANCRVRFRHLNVLLHGVDCKEHERFFALLDQCQYMITYKETNHWGCFGFLCVEYTIVSLAHAQAEFAMSHGCE